jgi:hypothetical protein
MSTNEHTFKSYTKDSSTNQNESIMMINPDGEKRKCLKGGFAHRAYLRKGYKEI